MLDTEYLAGFSFPSKALPVPDKMVNTQMPSYLTRLFDLG